MSAEGLGIGVVAEYEAIFAFGVAGPHLSGDLRDAARAAEQAHRDRRDEVSGWLTEAGREVPPAALSYALPVEAADEASATELITLVEERTAAAWRSVLADLVETERRLAVEALAGSAITSARWRRAGGQTPSTVPFPGRA